MRVKTWHRIQMDLTKLCRPILGYFRYAPHDFMKFLAFNITGTTGPNHRISRIFILGNTFRPGFRAVPQLGTPHPQVRSQPVNNMQLSPPWGVLGADKLSAKLFHCPA
jgi:hypothetical protein